MAYIYGINTIKKYLFGLIVITYVVSAAGVPGYLHYCSGELEKINYVVKSDSCCDSKEKDSEDANDGCCKDENVYLINSTDFIIKHSDFELANTISQDHFIALPWSVALPQPCYFTDLHRYFAPPVSLEQDLLVTTSVLRI